MNLKIILLGDNIIFEIQIRLNCVVRGPEEGDRDKPNLNTP